MTESMTKNIFTEDGNKLIRRENAIPECGEDFCDTCGDCLACYRSDECYNGDEELGSHVWIEYLG